MRVGASFFTRMPVYSYYMEVVPQPKIETLVTRLSASERRLQADGNALR